MSLIYTYEISIRHPYFIAIALDFRGAFLIEIFEALIVAPSQAFYGHLNSPIPSISTKWCGWFGI